MPPSAPREIRRGDPTLGGHETKSATAPSETIQRTHHMLSRPAARAVTQRHGHRKVVCAPNGPQILRCSAHHFHDACPRREGTRDALMRGAGSSDPHTLRQYLGGAPDLRGPAQSRRLPWFASVQVPAPRARCVSPSVPFLRSSRCLDGSKVPFE